MNKKSILATAIATGVGLNFSALASDNTVSPVLSLDSNDSGDNEIHSIKTDKGFNQKGGLLGSGMCCAVCRDLKLAD